jgi:hypothetical protein
MEDGVTMYILIFIAVIFLIFSILRRLPVKEVTTWYFTIGFMKFSLKFILFVLMILAAIFYKISG